MTLLNKLSTNKYLINFHVLDTANIIIHSTIYDINK